MERSVLCKKVGEVGLLEMGSGWDRPRKSICFDLRRRSPRNSARRLHVTFVSFDVMAVYWGILLRNALKRALPPPLPPSPLPADLFGIRLLEAQLAYASVDCPMLTSIYIRVLRINLILARKQEETRESSEFTASGRQ